MKYIVIVLSIALFLSVSTISIKSNATPAPAPYDCDAHIGVRMEVWNTKSGKLARAMFKDGRTPADVCVIPTGEVYEIATSAKADSLKARLCDQHYYSSYQVNVLKHDRLIFCKKQNPGPIATHTPENFCTVLYANYFWGSRLRDYWTTLPATCKLPLDAVVAKALSRRFK